MSDLSSTILRGTDQMSEAGVRLAAARNARTQRKQAAIRAASDSLSEIGNTIKEYGSFREAKRAEDEERDITSGLALGRATKGAEGVMLAAAAYRPTTKRGAVALYQGTKDAEEALRREQGVALDTAQAHHLGEMDRQAQEKRDQDAEERKATSAILAKDPGDWVKTPEDREIRDLFAARGITSANYVAYREQRRKEGEFATKEADKVRLTTAAEAGKTLRTKMNNETKTAIANAQIASREKEGGLDRTARAENIRSQLDAAKTNAENAILARTRADVARREWEGSPENPSGQRLAIMRDEQMRAWTKMRLDAKVKQLTLDRIVALSKGWNSDEDKSELLASIESEKGAVDDILGDIKTYEKAAPPKAGAKTEAVKSETLDDGSTWVKRPDGTWGPAEAK